MCAPSDVARLVSGSAQALEERLLNERENRLKGVRASVAAAEVAMTVARERAAGGEMDPEAAVTLSKMKVGMGYSPEGGMKHPISAVPRKRPSFHSYEDGQHIHPDFREW